MANSHQSHPPRFGNLRRLTNPAPYAGMSKGQRLAWRKLAPQICRWSPVTRLDIMALELLVSAVGLVEQCDCELAAAASDKALERRQLLTQAREQWAAEVAELCREFLIPSPEVWEQITAPSGVTLARLLAGPCDSKEG